MDNDRLIDFAVELQSLAQAGLTYCSDIFCRERYERIRKISAEMLSEISDIPTEKVEELFCNETGYQTPKIDTRAAIFDGDKILLVKEKNGKYSLPGGWCDVNVSVAENAVKETKEESGLDVIPKRIIAVQDREKHNRPRYAYGVCKIFIQCELIGGQFEKNSETDGFGWFSRDGLPELATEKNNAEQIKMCFDFYESKCTETLFD